MLKEILVLVRFAKLGDPFVARVGDFKVSRHLLCRRKFVDCFISLILVFKSLVRHLSHSVRKYP